MREIKFRVWVAVDKAFAYFDIYEYPQGVAGGVSEPQEYTGIKDKNGKEIYDGDIVSFNYAVGDFAWEAMDAEVRDINKEMMGKPYICNVVWCELNCGFMMVDGSVESSHIRFPMLYAKTGKVIGNIFEKS